jgi:hypothetical protein
MTAIDEIQQAMEHGASTMFLLGLLQWYKVNPQGAIETINLAAERLRLKREVPTGQ